MKLSLIVAMSENGVIGRDSDLPWHLSADLRRFKRLTMDHHIIMGRRTFESIGRILPGRTMIVVTRDENYIADGAVTTTDFARALKIAAADPQPFVIGGAQIYQLALPHVQTIYLTRILHSVEGDTFFPELNWSDWSAVETGEDVKSGDLRYRFETYERRNQTAAC